MAKDAKAAAANANLNPSISIYWFTSQRMMACATVRPDRSLACQVAFPMPGACALFRLRIPYFATGCNIGVAEGKSWQRSESGLLAAAIWARPMRWRFRRWLRSSIRALRPRLEVIAATSPASAARYARAYGFARATADWRDLVADPKVQAVVIASPQSTHREIAVAAFAAGKPVFCEKPLGASLEDAKAMVAAAEASGQANMIGFNYVRTPATQFVRQLLTDGAIGQVTWFRGEHTEDFLADPETPANWRTTGRANGCDGRPCAASDQLHVGLDGADGSTFGADRDGPSAPGPGGHGGQRRPRAD